MIHYVVTERYSSTIRRFLKGCPEMRPNLAPLTYEELFFERAGPAGHYIFTDFDRLSRYEVECAAKFAAALRTAAPDARILNDPLRALERYPLLVAFHKAGINDFTAVRLENGEWPSRYPVFIRAEDGYGAPETDLIGDDAAFEAALAELRRRGLPHKGRIAVGHAAEKNPDGFFRKYGAFNIAGTIMPHHLMRGDGWVVKVNSPDREWIHQLDNSCRLSADAVAEELAYVRENPHGEILRRAFAIAGIDFGRADYGVVGGRVQIYEINTNPSLPGALKNDARLERNKITRDRITAALKTIDTPISARGRIRFTELKPRPQNRHWPRRRLPASLLRRLVDVLAFASGRPR